MSDRTLHPLFSSFLGTVFILHGVLAPVRAESPALFGLDDIPLAPARLSLPDPSSALLGLGEIDLSRSRRWAALQEQSRLSGKDGAPAGARGGALPELAGLEQPALDSHLEQYVAEPLRQTGEHLKGLFANQQQVTGVLNQIQQGGVDVEQRLARAGEEKLQSMVDGRLQDIEQRLQGSILPQLNLSYRAPFAGREELFHVNATLSLWETSSHLLFNQGGLLLRDGKDGANLGLGYRFLAGEGLLLGVNTFYDWLSDPNVERWSVGAEARSAWLDLHGNWYQGRGNDRDGDTLYYSPDGWDIELAAHLPTVPWVELGASYYLWEGEGGQDDLEGLRYGLSLKPFTLWNIGLEYDDPDGDGGSWGVKTDLNYQFGVPLSNQLALRGTQGTPDLWSRRYEKVEREYAIRVREQRTVRGERLSIEFADLIAADPMDRSVPVRSPAGRIYVGSLMDPPATDYFTVTHDLPGEITFTVARTSATLATLTLTYTRATPLPDTTPTGTIRITALDTGLIGNSGDLSNQVIVDVLAAAPTTARVLLGEPLPFRMVGCSADACVVPASGAGVPLPVLQLPVTPVESSTCPTCQISLAFDLEFGGTAVYGDDYTVTGLTLTSTRDPDLNPAMDPPTPPATASDTFMVRLDSLSTHYLNVMLILMPDTDPDTNAERKDIQLVYVDRGDDDLIDNEDDRGAPQTVLTLEPAGTSLPFADVADTTLTERSLIASTATVVVTLSDSVYVETGALDTADFTLTADVPGTVTVAGVTRTSDTVATLMLRHEGADIVDISGGVDGTLDVIVEASAHTGAVALYAGSVSIDAMSGVATLSGLTVSPGALTPPFASTTTDYTLNVASTVTSVTLTPTAAGPGATLSVFGSTVTSGSVTTIGGLTAGGMRVVPIVVTAEDGRTMPYQVRIINASGPQPVISIAAETSPVTEGTAATFTLTANPAPAANLTVTVTVTDSGNFIAGAAPTTVTIAGSATTATLEVPTTDDATDEANGTITAMVTAGTGYTVGSPPTDSVTVNDDDAAPTLAIDSPSVAEGNAGETPTLSYTVTLTGETEQQVTVDYTDTTSGTATSGTDYTAITAGTLTFAPGTTTQNIDVTVTGDAADEGDETVILRLSGAVNATITTADGTGTITDDDGGPAAGVTVSQATLSVPENGSTTADYTLILDTAPTADVTIAVESDTVTAATVSSASLTFTPANWNTAQTVTVTGVNDNVDNPGNERTATVTHAPTSTDAGYGSVGIDPVTVTVQDDDDPGTGTVTVTLNPGIAGNDEVNIAELAGGLTIGGTVADGATVEVSFNGGTTLSATVSSTDWSLDIPPTSIGTTVTSVVVVVTATLGLDTGTRSRTVAIDLVAPTATYAAPGTLTVGTAITDIEPGTPSADIASYAVQSGDIPPGLTLASDGIISGAPSTANAATATVEIRLTDGAGNPTDVQIIFPAVGIGSQTLIGFAYSAVTATVGQPPPTVTAPTGAVASSTLSYASGDTDVCTVNPSTGALTLVAAGACVITVTASMTANYQSATDTFTITVAAAGAAGVTVTPTALTVPEDGSSMGTYTLVLDTAPTADVTIAVASDTDTAATVSSASLTFTTTNWNTAQTVTVTGVNDDVPGDRTATVTHAATSGDTTYNSVVIVPVTVTVEDDDAVAPSATLAAADPTTLGERRLNSSTNRATVTVTLMNTVYEPPAELTADDFMLSDTVDGMVTVNSVTRTSDTVATLALAHTGAISSDGTVSVTVLDSAHTGSGDLPAGSLPIDATAPTVSSVAFSTTGPYGLGADIEMTITFNENVFVEGTTPNAILSTNSANRSAPYNRGSGSMELVFRHTVVAGDDDADGVEIFRSPLLGGGGIIRDAAGNDVGRLLTNSAITGGITQRVDATLPMLLTATVTGTALTLTYNEALDDTSTTLPSTTDYMVTVDTVVPVLVNSVAISDMTVTLTLASVVIGGRPVTLSYTPGANPVQDTVGNDAVMLDDRGVSNPSGTVSVSLNTIAGDDVVNIAERTAGFTISGMVADGATVEVTLEGGTPRGATETGTTWTLDIPSDDPDIIGTSVDVEATATLLGATGMVIRPLTLDLVAPTATYALPLTLMVGTTITAIMPGTPSADITSYALQAGTLPPGLTLTLDGTGGGTAGGISGTPTTANVATALVTIRLTDTASNPGDISITFPAVDLGSQTLDGFAYSADTATIGQTAPTVTAPTGAVVGSTLSYASGDEDVCTVDSVTGALTLVAAGSCVITVTASATNYNEATANFTITVSEVAGVTVSETERTVPEDGGMADYTVILTSAPTAEVTIAVASDTDTAATVSPASLTFTTTNWDTAQTVTVTGVNDDIDNPSDERTATLSHTPTSADAGYNTVPIASVTVTVTDDDDAGITVSETELAVAEADGTGAYTLILNTQPAADVTIAVVSDAPLVATVSSASLTFTPTNWNTAQTVTVTGVDDTINNTPPRTATVSHTATSTDTNYDAEGIDPVTVTATDDDAALPVISIAAGTSPVIEGTAATFTVTADTAPMANLSVMVTVTDSGDFIAGVAPTTVTIAAGATTATLTVATMADTDDEPNGVVTATLRTGTGYMVGAPDTASVAVRDNDGATDPVISIAAGAAVMEGTTATFTVTATSAPAADLTVTVTVDDGAGNFIAGVAPTTVTITASATEATLMVATMADSIDEANGTITATVTIGAGYTVDGTNNTASVTVNDDDAEPTLAISSPSVPEGNSGSVMLRYTVTLTGATEREVTVDYADAGTGTATSGTDYETITAGTLTFTPGDATTQDIDVTVTGDAIDEGDGETVIVTLSGAVNAMITTPDGTGTITDDDAEPTLTINSPSVAEGDAGETPTLTYTVTLNGATEQTVTVDYADAGAGGSGTATSGTDYDAITPDTLTFVPGTTTQTITVMVTGDTDEEGDETVIVTLSNPDNATIATADGTGTIRGDDAPVLPTISIAAGPSPVTEADNATFTLTADPAPGTELIVTVTVDDGSGNFIASPAPTMVTITASTTTATLMVSTDDDSVDEAEGMITATVTAGAGYTIALSPDNSATVTVADNDPAPTLAINSPTVLEGDSGSTAMLRYTVTLSGETEQEVTVAYADAAGTATPDTDYETLTAGTLTFTSGGATAQNIDVIVTGDAIDEEDETVVLRLSGAVNAEITTPDGTGTITDDDAAPTLAIDSLSVAEGTTGETPTLTYTVTLTGNTEQEVTVAYADAGATGGGTATSGTDYETIAGGTLTFAPGTTTQTITVTVTGDTEDEGDGETVIVRLSNPNPVGVIITTPDGTGTITDDDDPTLPAISIAAGPSPVTEGDDATFTLTVAPAPMTDLTVTVTVDDGAGDFIASPAPTMVTITASNTTVTLTVMTEDDTTDEAAGMITATVTIGAGYTVSSPSTARVTVQDNDIVITGTPTGAVTEDAPTETATDTLVVEGGFVEQDGTTDRARGLGAYGSFVLDATSGVWIYTLNNDPTTTQGAATNALAEGDVVTEVFTAVSAADPSVEQEVTITITGANDAPTADAGLMQTVTQGITVTLDGSGSSDPDTGDMIDAYAWTQSSTPTVTLDATIEMPTFTAPAVTSPTDLGFSLVVNDGDTDSAPDPVTITVNPASAAPVVSTVEISSTGPYAAGDDIEVTVTFSEMVNVTDTPQIALMVDATTRQATYDSGTGTTALVFLYTVVDGENDADGVSIPANSLAQVAGSTIQDTDGTDDATLTHPAVDADPAQTVDTTAPTVSEVELSSDGPYALDEDIEVTVTFSEAVTVSGAPEITLTVGANERQATFSSGSDTVALVFTYTVAATETDDNGVSIPEDTLAQASGSAIQDTAGNDAVLDHDAVDADPAHAVDTTAPAFDSATVDADVLVLTYSENLDESSAPDNGDYTIGVTPGTAPTVTGVTLSGTDVTLMLSTPVTSDQTVTVSYTVGSTPLQDLAGNDAIELSDATVTNNTPMVLPTISIAAGSSPVTEVDNATFTLTATPAPGTDLTVTVTVTETGTFLGSPVPTTVMITASTTTATLTVPIDDDSIDEAPGMITATVTAGTGYMVDGAGNTASVTVNDNDAAPALAIDSPPMVTEGDDGDTATLSYTVTLSGDTTQEVTVDYADAGLVGGGTATSGADYEPITGGTLTFAPGTTTQTIDVTVRGDAIDEPDEETIIVMLSNPDNATIATDTGTGTITDNDPEPTLAIDSPNMFEGDDGDTATLRYTVTLSGDTEREVTVGYADAGTGTAASGTDYEALTAGTLTFAPGGATTQNIDVTVMGDVDDEGDEETVVVRLSGAVNATITTPDGTGTITDDDDPPALAINAPSVDEGDSGSVTLSYTVTLTGTTAQTVMVDYADAGSGTATSGTDYETITGGTLTFTPGGATTQTIAVTVTGDTIDEEDETVILRLSGAVNAEITTPDGTGTIDDDDDPPMLAISSPTMNEGNSGRAMLRYVVTLTGNTEREVTVDYADTSGGTATSGTDYDPITAGTLTFAPGGAATQNIDLMVVGDTIDEEDETVILRLSGAVNATISTADGTGTITDDDDEPTLAINSLTVPEGDSGSVMLRYTVTLNGATARTVTVQYADAGTTGGGTATSGADYDAITAGTLTFTPGGAATQTIDVMVRGDTIDEEDQTVILRLSGATNATITTPDGTGTITDDDAEPGLAINSPSVGEGDSMPLRYTVRLIGATEKEVTVQYEDSRAGSATSGADYDALTAATLTFAPGTTTQNIDVTVTDDTMNELTETVLITLSNNPVNARITTGTGTGRITDDDVPVISIAAGPAVNEGTAATFTLTANPAPAADLTVMVTVDDGAGDFIDGAAPTMVTITAGNREATLDVRTDDDSTDEVDGMITVTVTAGAGYMVAGGGDSTDSVTVRDDDDPVISIAAGAPVTEGTPATFTVTASSAPMTNLTVTVTVDDGAGNFIASPAPTTVTILASAMMATLTVPTTDDTTDEANGMITATVTDGAGYTVDGANNTDSVAVNDDDDPPTLAINSPSVDEGDTGDMPTLTYTVTLTGETEQEVTVDYADTTSGTAASGTDYTAITASTLTFAPGMTTQPINVTVRGDTIDEPNETVIVMLSNPDNATITAGSGVGTGTITDDDDPVISIVAADPTVIEGASATFTVRATSAPAANLSVMVAVTDGAGTFITGMPPTTVTIPASAMMATLTVPTTDDNTDEAPGMITATVETGTGYRVAPPPGDTARVTVNDNDALPRLAIDSPSVGEGNTGTATLSYTVTLIGATARTVMVDYADAGGGTATSGTDYTAITAGTTLTFAPGTTTQPINVTVTGDTTDEPNETVFVMLSNPVNATITAGRGTGTITDDDDPEISIVAGAAVTEGTAATFTLTASSAPGTNLTVTVTVDDGAGNFIAGSAPTTVTITGGERTAMLMVPTMADSIDEANGMITATVEDGTGYTVAGGGANTASVAVNDNDPPPTLAIDSPSVAEGDDGDAPTLSYTVTLTGDTEQEVTVGYADADSGTATSGTDYEAVTAGTLTFAPGTTTQPIEVTVTGDATDVEDETVILTLSGAVNATITTADGTGTITDDDRVPVISIVPFGPETVIEGTPPTAVRFTLMADPAPMANLTVTVTVDPGTYADGIPPTTVTITGGETMAMLPVPIENDERDEANGMITATVETGTGYTVASPPGNTASVAVEDDDDEPTLAINSPSVTEGNSGTATLRYVVTLTGMTEREVTVRYAEGSGGTATSGTDYNRITGGMLTFASGTTTQNIDVTVRGDTTDEPNETVIVTLSNPDNATIMTADGTGTITDDDDPEISIAAGAAVTEGTAATFTLTATSAPGTNLTVTVTVDDGSGNFIAGVAPTTVTITGTTATLRVPTMGDSIDEANGMITATVETGTGYTVDGTNNSASVAVNDDDAAPTLAIDSPSVAEGDSGTATLSYEVTLTGATEREVMVQYAGTGGTATSGTDYTAITAGTLTFAPSVTTQNINVTVRGDTVEEMNETVFVTLSSPVNATIVGNGRGTGTITDDDGVVALPVISIRAVGSFVNEGVPAIFTLTATPAPMADLTVTVTVDPGTYADGIPPTTVTITGGETTAMLTVLTENDMRQEQPSGIISGPITATVEDGAGYTVGSPNTATLSVIDADSPPSLSIDSPSVAEGNAGMTRLRYTVTLTNESELMVTVDYADETGTAAGDTATSGTDYTPLPSGTLTFAPRTTTQNIDVMVIGDTDVEPDETVIVRLSNPVNARTGSSLDRTGTGTITDDDLPVISIAAGPSPVIEGAPATFRLTANPAPAANLTVTVAVSDGAGDFIGSPPPPPTVVIPSGGSVTLSVPTNDDTADEPNGMITATVGSGTGYTVDGTNNTASVTVNDNDTAVVPVISIAAGTSSVIEGAPATFTLRANVPPPATLTVMVTVTASGDFIGSPLPTTVMITTSGLVTLTVPTMDDSINEPDGIITVTVTAGTGYTVATGGGNTASVTVQDNDVPAISIAAGPPVTEGALVTFTLTANPTPAADLTVTVTVTDSGDFITGAPPATVTITGSATTATLEVPTTDDTTPETLGMITAMVTAGDGYTVGTPAMATVDVRDDDTGIVISIVAGTSPVPEGMAATFTLTADPAPLANLTVTVTVTDSGDFITSAPMPTVVIPPAGSVTLTVPTTDDTTPEPNGVITATVTSGAGYMPAGGGADSASVTVNNDDREAPTEPGVFVSQTELSIEEGSEAIYTVVLDTAPTDDVTITPMVAPASDVLSETFSSGDEVPATVSEALTFTPANWNVPQPVTVTGVDNNRTGALFLQVRVRHMASSSDGDYDSVGIASVRVDVFDDDPLLIISHTERTVAEAGGMAEYTVVMGFRLSVDLPVSLVSDAPTVATVSPPDLTFTPSNWDTPRTVTVTGVNDPFDNPDDRTATISHTHMVDGRDFGSPSLTEDIRNFVSRSVVVTATDDETAGVTISPAPGMPMVSLGDEATYTVVLDTPPTDGVLIILREEFFQDGSAMVVDVSPFDERTLIPLPLRFTPSAWNVPQTVTVFGREVGTASLMYSAGSRDDSYHEIDIAPLVITVADNGPVARVRVSPAMVQVGEDSGTTEYTVVLDNRPPTADVTITPASGDTAIATVSPTELTFTPDNWNIAQPVTVTGVDDPDYNPPFGNRAVAVSHTAASSDVNYNGRSIDPVTVTVVDDEIRPAGVIVTDIIGGLIIVGELDDFDTELGMGRTNTYALVLNRQPTDNVTVTPRSGDTAIARVSGALTFTPDNWNTAQTVTVTGVNDDVDNSGDTRTVTITHTAVSMEDAYDGITIDTVTVTVEDDDTPGAIVSPTELSIEENGDGIYTVVLGTVPTAPVMITPMVAPNSDVLSETFSPGDEVPATVSGVALTFTTTNWNVPQTVTVTGVDNNRTGTLFLRVRVRHMAESLDSDYNGVGIASVRVDVFDDDPLLIISESALTVAENGGMATYTVVMGVRLSVDLPVSLASDTTSVATVSSTGLTFTPDNWDTPQTVTVTGVNDPFDNPDDRTATISHTHMVDGRDFGSSSEEEDIRELVSRSVVVTAIDDETAGVTISPDMHMVSVRSRATYTVVLDTPPTDGVLIILREEFFQDGAAMVVDVSPFDARTLIPLPLRFTPSTWNVPQTVTVFGREAGTASLMYRARSRDDSYHDIDIAPLVITVVE